MSQVEMIVIESGIRRKTGIKVRRETRGKSPPPRNEAEYTTWDCGPSEHLTPAILLVLARTVWRS